MDVQKLDSETDSINLRNKIFELVSLADLKSVTVKGIRLQLEKDLSCDLSEKKTAITELVKEALQKRISSEPELLKELSSSSPAVSPSSSPHKISKFPSNQDISTSPFSGPSSSSKIKNTNEHKKENEEKKINTNQVDKVKDIPAKTNGRSEIINGFHQENKLEENRMIHDDGDDDRVRQEIEDLQLALQLQAQEGYSLRRKSSSLSKSKSSRSSKLTTPGLNHQNGKEASSTPKKRKTDGKSRSGFPSYNLSPAMSDFMSGETSSTSSQVTKEIWQHIKSHQLQDPKDKRYILCDETLKKILGKERIHMFHIAKEIQRHLIPMD